MPTRLSHAHNLVFGAEIPHRRCAGKGPGGVVGPRRLQDRNRGLPHHLLVDAGKTTYAETRSAPAPGTSPALGHCRANSGSANRPSWRSFGVPWRDGAHLCRMVVVATVVEYPFSSAPESVRQSLPRASKRRPRREGYGPWLLKIVDRQIVGSRRRKLTDRERAATESSVSTLSCPSRATL